MKIKTIDVNAKEWFDRINGNSYFSGIITINYGMKDQKEFIMPVQYGYDEHYKTIAMSMLKELGYIGGVDQYTPLWRWCNDNNVILRTSKQEGCLKREVWNV